MPSLVVEKENKKQTRKQKKNTIIVMPSNTGSMTAAKVMTPPAVAVANGGVATTNGTSSASVISTSKSSRRDDGICDSVLDVIGDTPLVRLNKIGDTEAPGIEFLAKCEFFNAGGSVKDRIGRQMVLDAEASGRIKPGVTTLIEPTSGNTGIGLALAAAVRGYKCIITMPEKMSKEKVDVLKALGAEIVRTPTEAAFDAPDSHISVARRLQQEIPNAHILDQYSNPSNPNAHYMYTAQEIINQCSSDGKKVDLFVAGAGTGGTITGIAKRLREVYPDIIVVGVDPKGSILALPDSLNDENRLESYLVEGIGYDFIPQVLERNVVNHWIKSNDRDSLLMMRRLIRDEGLLCGGSSGGAVSAALKAAQLYLKPGQRCVVLLPDSVRNYMTKALSDDWMSDQGIVDGDIIKAKSFHQAWWASRKVYELPLATPLTITSDVTCKDAISLLKQEGFDMVPVLDDAGAVVGVVTEGNITSRLLSGRCHPNTTVEEAGVCYKTFHKFTMNDTLSTIAQALDHDPFVLIVTEQRCFSSDSSRSKKRKMSSDGSFDSISEQLPQQEPSSSTAAAAAASPSTASKDTRSKLVTRSVISGIVSRIDLLDFISHHDPPPE